MNDPDTAERVTPTASAFVGHGNPMNALERNRYTEAWRTLGERVGRPRAILAVSAHWYIHATAVTAMPKPRTIHDFYGFPDELFAMRYPAPGSPEIAEEIADVVSPTWVGLDADSWGIDHGTWSVLVHAFPTADVPVLQLAINAAKPFEYHFEVGTRLAPLRERGIFVVGSGNVVHNLGRVDWSQRDTGTDWAHRFDDAAREVMTTDPSRAVGLAEHRDFQLAVPTPDHFLPLLYFAGIAHASGSVAEVLVDGYAYGSLSMTSYTLGLASRNTPESTAGAPPLPRDVPADDTNL
jgi:4,5-DOPA dioxygenase extradiol